MRRAIGRAGATLAAVLLGACATHPSAPAAVAQAPPPPPPPKVVTVRVPTPVKCVPTDLGPAPTYPDTDAALRDAGGAADRYQLLAAGRILRQQRLQRLEEVVRHCRTVGR